MSARLSLLAAALLLAFAPAAFAAGGLSASPSGWVAASANVHPSEDDALAMAGLRGGLALDGGLGDLGFRLSLEGYANLAGLGDGVDGDLAFPDPLSLAWSGNDRLMAALDLKEAWVEFSAGDFDFRLGKQVLAWGLADGNNPTDNINARHVGTRIVTTLDEQKMGTLALNAVYNLPGNLGTMQGLFMPIAVRNDMPEMTMDLYIPGSPPMVPNQRVVMLADENPEPAVENVEGGVRGLFYLGNLSLSASFLSYLDRYPDYEVTSSFDAPSSTATTTLAPVHGRIEQFGLDAAWLGGGWDLRTEWALALTMDGEGNNPAVRNSGLSGVVQASRSFIDGKLTTSAAWAPRLVFDFMESADYASAGDQYIASMMSRYSGQAYAFEQALSLRLAGKLLNETLQPELMLLGEVEARDYLLTAGATYNLADGLNLKLGAGLYGSLREAGDPEREYGLFSNSRVIDQDYLSIEIKYSF